MVVATPGHLRVTRPNMRAQDVDVAPIGQHCLRGPKHCNCATEQMQLVLRDP